MRHVSLLMVVFVVLVAPAVASAWEGDLVFLNSEQESNSSDPTAHVLTFYDYDLPPLSVPT